MIHFIIIIYFFYYCRVDNFRCKHMTEGLLGHYKSVLSNSISSEDVQESDDHSIFTPTIAWIFTHLVSQAGF